MVMGVGLTALTSRKGPVRVIQISDSHLFADESGCLLGMNTQDSFESVMRLVEREQSTVDCVIATGDISQDASKIAYQRFASRIEVLGAPIYWLPGNHDKVDVMAGVVEKPAYLSPTRLDIGERWSIILLNSVLPGEVPGALSKDELSYLRESLEISDERHVLVSMHHHPVMMGSEWLDGVALLNPDPFWELIVSAKSVKSVVWGHVHQEYDQMHYGKRCLSPPSTCVQFKPKSVEFAVDDQPPGYRWLDLYPDGRIETGISRVHDQAFSVDLNGTGY